MPLYHQLGRVPRKRHVAFRKDDGSLHYEELVGNQGFTGPSSLLYHLRLPTAVKAVRPIRGLGWVAEPERVVRHRHFRTTGLVTGPSAVLDRVPLLFNSQVAISMARPRKEDAFFYRNGQGDEVVYVVEGRRGPRVGVRRARLEARRLRRDPAGNSPPLAARRGPVPPARRRERGLRAHAEALPQRARPADRDGALLRARHPPARAPRRARRDGRARGGRQERQPPRRDDGDAPPPRRRRVGRLLLPVGAQHPRLRGARRPAAPAAARPSDVRGRRVRDLLVRAAPVRLRCERGARARTPTRT